MTWKELENLTKEYPNIRLIYKGKDRITVEFATDEGLKPKPPKTFEDGLEYYFEAGM